MAVPLSYWSSKVNETEPIPSVFSPGDKIMVQQAQPMQPKSARKSSGRVIWLILGLVAVPMVGYAFYETQKAIDQAVGSPPKEQRAAKQPGSNAPIRQGLALKTEEEPWKIEKLHLYPGPQVLVFEGTKDGVQKKNAASLTEEQVQQATDLGEIEVQFKHGEKVRVRIDADTSPSAAASSVDQPAQVVNERNAAVPVKPDDAPSKPKDATVHLNLGLEHYRAGRLDKAVDEFRAAIAIKPDDVTAQTALGLALCDQGKHEAAIPVFRASIRLKPNFASHFGLGNALYGQGKIDESVAEFRAAIRLGPDDADTHTNLGTALVDQGDLDEAMSELRTALRINPNDAIAHYNLGLIFSSQGKHAEAVAECRTAVRINPRDPKAHANLGVTLQGQGDLQSALAALREAEALVRRGSIAALRVSWRIDQVETQQAMLARLPSILNGDEQPKNVAERLEFAKLCSLRALHAAAVRLYASAFAAKPDCADDRKEQYRYLAARSAVMAGSGPFPDEAQPDDAAKARFRARALGWMTAELYAWSKVAGTAPPQDRATVRQTMQNWRNNADMAGIRDPEALARLPEAERQECEDFWADVEFLMKRSAN